MIAKKSTKADLEKKRFAFFQIGMLVAGSLALAAFEYNSAEISEKIVQFNNDRETWVPNEDVYEIIEDRPLETSHASVTMPPIDDLTITTRTMPEPGITVNPGVIVIDEGDGGYGPIGDIVDIGEILPVAEIEPMFPGGETAMAEFIRSKVRYPSMPMEMGIQGITYIEFVVNTDGSICQIKAKSNLHKDLEKEAMRVVGLMPNWIPGEQAGKKVRVRYTVPINFVIK